MRTASASLPYACPKAVCRLGRARADFRNAGRERAQEAHERLRLCHPGERRQGQHLADREMPRVRPQAACSDLAARRAARPSGSAISIIWLRSASITSTTDQPQGRSAVHAQGVRAFRQHGHSDAPGHLLHPAADCGGFRNPAVVWGENSAFEYGNAETRPDGPSARPRPGSRTYGVTHGTTAADWVDAELSARRISRPISGPIRMSSSAHGVRAVFLGHYFAWDPQTSHAVAAHMAFARTQAARAPASTISPISTTISSRIHHWMKWYKFGFTRAVRQSVARNPQRPHDARAGCRDHCAAAATRHRRTTSRSSARLPAFRRRVSSILPSGSAIRTSGPARTVHGPSGAF